MKIGLDIHGTIDKDPKLFEFLSKYFVNNGHEVHIITGSMKTPEIEKKLKEEYKITYTHFFSVSDYLISQGKQVSFSSPDNPWFDNDEWVKAKGEYCKRENILIHLDDNEEYKKYFPKNTRFIKW